MRRTLRAAPSLDCPGCRAGRRTPASFEVAIAPQIIAAESLSRANQPQARAILQRLEINRSYVMDDDGHDRLLR
jgi:hypothetical protein